MIALHYNIDVSAGKKVYTVQKIFLKNYNYFAARGTIPCALLHYDDRAKPPLLAEEALTAPWQGSLQGEAVLMSDANKKPGEIPGFLHV